MSYGIFTRDVLRDRFMTILSCCAASRDDIQVDFVAKFVFVSASSKREKYQTRKERKIYFNDPFQLSLASQPEISAHHMKPTQNLEET